MLYSRASAPKGNIKPAPRVKREHWSMGVLAAIIATGKVITLLCSQHLATGHGFFAANQYNRHHIPNSRLTDSINIAL